MGSAGFFSYKKPGNPFCDLTPLDDIIKVSSDLLIVFSGEIVVGGLVEILVAQLSEAFYDIVGPVGPVHDDRGATLVCGFDYYVVVRRKLFQCFELCCLDVPFFGSWWYAVL